MLQERIEPVWIDAFEAVLRRCALQAGDTVAILGETQSRPVLPELARLAAARLGAQAFTLTLPSVFARGEPVARSTGASPAIQQIGPVIAALQACTLVVDCTVEGLMHAPELPAILRGNGSSQPRIVYVSNEHPEALARLLPDDATEARVKDHVKRLRAAQAMRVTSPAGTDLSISLQGAVAGGNWGSTIRPGTLTHWPGGLVLAFPAAGSVNGTLVLAEGDVNLTFKRYIERAITLTIENDYVTRIEGGGVDAGLLRSYFAAWNEKEAYAVSHVLWPERRRALGQHGALRQARLQRHRAARVCRQLPLQHRRQRNRPPLHPRPFRLADAGMHGVARWCDGGGRWAGG